MRDAQWCRQLATHRPQRCSAVHSAAGLRAVCPPDNHLGDAESRELQHLADSQMDSERHTDRDAICVK
jgi:hypothetical protein